MNILNQKNLRSSAFARMRASRTILLPFMALLLVSFLLFSASTAFGQTVKTQVTVYVTIFDVKTKSDTFTSGVFGNSKLLPTESFKSDLLRLTNEKTVRVLEKPSQTVNDGTTGLLEVGRQISISKKPSENESLPVLVETRNAGNRFKVEPVIIRSEKGEPQSVQLALELANNEIDGKRTDSDGIPVIIQREVGGTFNLDFDETMILGGFISKDGKTCRYFAVSVEYFDYKF